jgi:hypothetical protein
MTDVLVKQQNRIIYAFSGTIAIPMYKQLQINCIHLDPSFRKINYMLNPAINKHTAPDFTEDDYRTFLELGKHKSLEDTINVPRPNSKLLPIEDHDQTIWKTLKPFFKKRKHIELVTLMHKKLKRPIVYIDREHNIKVFPNQTNYPNYTNHTNFTKPPDFPNFIYYFDHNHIVGTDIKHPKNLKVLVITNYRSKEYVVVQAMYRIRGIHDKQNGHQLQFALDVIYTPTPSKRYNPKQLLNIGENKYKERGLTSLRAQSKIWKRNEKEEVDRNRIYLQYQYDFALHKLKYNEWTIESFQKHVHMDNNILINLQSTVNVQNDANVDLNQVQDKATLTLDTKGKLIEINEQTHEIMYNSSFHHITKHITISDYCVRYMNTSTHDDRHVFFIISDRKCSTMIHIDEFLENLDRLDEDIHIISNIYGHEIFPKPNLFIDWVLPVITHAPTISFYHMLEMYHSQDKTQEFYSLQKIFETKWTLFTPIISWKPSCTSTIISWKPSCTSTIISWKPSCTSTIISWKPSCTSTIISWKPSCTSTILDQNTLDSYQKKTRNQFITSSNDKMDYEF